MSKLKEDKDGFWVIEGSRADFTYTPLSKQLREVMYFPMNKPELRPMLGMVLSNHIS